MVPTFSPSPAESNSVPISEANAEIVLPNKPQTVEGNSAGKEAVTSRAKRVTQKRIERKLLTASKSVQKKDVASAAKSVLPKRKREEESSSYFRRKKVESTPVPLVCFPQVLTDRLRESEFAQKPQSTNSSQSKPVGIMRSLKKGLN